MLTNKFSFNRQVFLLWVSGLLSAAEAALSISFVRNNHSKGICKVSLSPNSTAVELQNVRILRVYTTPGSNTVLFKP